MESVTYNYANSVGTLTTAGTSYSNAIWTVPGPKVTVTLTLEYPYDDSLEKLGAKLDKLKRFLDKENLH